MPKVKPTTANRCLADFKPTPPVIMAAMERGIAAKLRKGMNANIKLIGPSTDDAIAAPALPPPLPPFP